MSIYHELYSIFWSQEGSNKIYKELNLTKNELFENLVSYDSIINFVEDFIETECITKENLNDQIINDIFHSFLSMIHYNIYGEDSTLSKLVYKSVNNGQIIQIDPMKIGLKEHILEQTKEIISCIIR